MPLPTMTPEQRAGALAKAQEARQARSGFLAQVKSGALTLEQVFERADDEVVKKTRVLQVLRALPGYGPSKVSGADGHERRGREAAGGRFDQRAACEAAGGRHPITVAEPLNRSSGVPGRGR